MLKLKLQYFGHLMGRVGSLEQTLTLGGIGGRRRRGRQRMRWLDSITDLMDMSLSELRGWWWTERPCVLWFMGSQRVGHDWATEPNWTWLSVFICLGVQTRAKWSKSLGLALTRKWASDGTGLTSSLIHMSILDYSVIDVQKRHKSYQPWTHVKILLSKTGMLKSNLAI